VGDLLLIHPLGEIVTGLIEAGMRLAYEHDAVPWRMFRVLVREARGLYRWPGKPWLPLAFPPLTDGSAGRMMRLIDIS